MLIIIILFTDICFHCAFPNPCTERFSETRNYRVFVFLAGRCSSWTRRQQDMSFSQGTDAQLLQLPWRTLRIGDCTFLGKVCFAESGYALLLSDLSSVWCEEAEADAIQERARKLNKRLKAPVSSFLSYLSQIVFPALDSKDNGQNVFSCHRTEAELVLQVKSQLSGLPFYWNFHCKEAKVSTVCRHLVNPLMSMAEALERQNQELYLLLGKKDAEIQEYQDSGAVLTRGRLKTEVFDELKFQESFMAEKVQVLSKSGETHGFSEQLQRLYHALTAPAPVNPKGEGKNVRYSTIANSTNLSFIVRDTEGFCAHIKAQGCRLSYTGNSEYHSCIIRDNVPPTVNDKDISSH
uniref:Non-homologous end-joining factor 1 n=1 Tax=Xenopus tropicalis TaxID=8364 RepID=A0A6I8QI50_XENTR